ncbi:ribosome-recycling factor [alpha proteobacterium AAP38]|uniref:Ribosome-recycling factor n=1 Tax=Niveispirillum cyanobacteriorum TaxID=1612173 RepID=A0A2K9N9L5_9PROT|nr:ribosome recycling factor [Niveispirillum cyanobacteriorum]AUN29840.1 ribosome recycling factor [Niveispirillum cyanobacteriorum]KPF86227.1 ribosome-recycling factor [alpha proteobacterium AAP38]MBJ7417996.1 ribosome recycling factor [Niveispirillum sp.]GGE60275.1 ribosome-recycling factor [Niveispirillum cyanobacteriorum]
MAAPELIKDIERRMAGALEQLRKEFAGLRTGRASANLLEPVTVEAYGTTVPLNQVANISVPEPRLISVQVFDRSTVKSVEKAIRDSGLGLNPQTEGSTIRVPIPELNSERRKELSKVAAKYAEQTRVAVRNVRRDAMDALKKLQKDGSLSEDEQKTWSDKVQGVTDAHIKKVDEALATKEKEILQV